MKILHIIDSLGLGGAQTVVRGIFESQKDNGDIFLFALRKRDVTIEVDHVNVKIFNSTQKYSFKAIAELKKLITKEKIDVLHCHLFKSQLFGLVIKIFYFPSIKLVFHEHGRIFQKSFGYKNFIRFSKGFVDLFLAVSIATKNILMIIGHVPEEKIKVLCNFVDLEKFSIKNINWNIQEEKEKIGIKEGEFVVGFVGRLSKVKGCEYLIRALPYLDFSYKCVIAGDGDLMAKMKKLAKELKIDDRVVFLGYRVDVLKIYSMLDVLTVPSLSESFGISVIEAQAVCVPVVASFVGGLREVIKDNYNGLFFEKKNKQCLAKKINLIFNNRIMRKNIINNGLLNAKGFSINKYIKDLVSLYEI